MAKDETELGITGLPIPKKKMSPAKRHEFEKKRRANLGQNVGGRTYSSDVTPGYNPRQRTFEEFMNIAEGKKSNIPPNAVPGTYHEDPDGSMSYTLKPASAPAKALKKPLSKKDIFKELDKQGGIGGKAIEKELKRRKKNK